MAILYQRQHSLSKFLSLHTYVVGIESGLCEQAYTSVRQASTEPSHDANFCKGHRPCYFKAPPMVVQHRWVALLRKPFVGQVQKRLWWRYYTDFRVRCSDKHGAATASAFWFAVDAVAPGIIGGPTGASSVMPTLQSLVSLLVQGARKKCSSSFALAAAAWIELCYRKGFPQHPQSNTRRRIRQWLLR